MSEQEIETLVETLYRHGTEDNEGRQAMKRLAQLGEPAFKAINESVAHPPKSDLHPFDLRDVVTMFYYELARSRPSVLLKAISQEPPCDLYYAALGSASDEQSFKVLLEALKHRNAYVRSSAADALIQRRDKRAVPALIDTLRDRSRKVKSPIIWAMEEDEIYRRPEAVPLLERVVASASLRKSAPGLWEKARNLIARIKVEG